MTPHLSPAELNAMVDGELSPEQTGNVNEHLAGCPACTANALSKSLLKSAIARAGERYPAPDGLRQRLLLKKTIAGSDHGVRAGRSSRAGLLGWAVAATILLGSAGSLILQQERHASSEIATLTGQVSDEHLATLAMNSPLQVLSNDRHTVKPWFQGKLPFSFNLPENLPSDTRLEGANLAYIQGQPVAQLVYSIGKHRVSVFVVRQDREPAASFAAEHAGFHVKAVREKGYEIVAVSDADGRRLADLVNQIGAAQS